MSLRLLAPCGRMRTSLVVVLATVVGCVPVVTCGTPTICSAPFGTVGSKGYLMTGRRSSLRKSSV